MATTTSTTRPSHFVDAATLTDSQLFLVTRILVDVAVSTEDTEVTEGSRVGEEWRRLDGIPCIMGGLRALIASLSGTLHGRTTADFPWKTLPKELACLGKGIHDLTHQHHVNLINCLKAGTLTIRAVTSDAAHTRLTTSKDPVVIGDAPLACSTHSRGRHVFADGRIDQKDQPHLPTSSCRAQVIVEITWPPPRPASRALHKPSTTSRRDLIPAIASIQGESSSEDVSADDEDDYEDEDPQITYSFGSASQAMMLNLSDYYSDPPDDQVSSPPPYLPASLSATMGSGYAQEEYVQEQFGGGRYKDTPTELTPSRLCSTIKPTSRDTTNSFVANSIHFAENSHHNTPLVEDAPVQCSVQVQDLFANTLAPTCQQPAMPQNTDVFHQQPQYGTLNSDSMALYNLTIPSRAQPLWSVPSPLMQHKAPSTSPSPLASYSQLPTSPLLMPALAGPSSQGGLQPQVKNAMNMCGPDWPWNFSSIAPVNSLPAQGAVPRTHIIPPTPIKPAELLAPSAASGSSQHAVTFSTSTAEESHIKSDFTMDNDGAPVGGRHSAETNSTLDEGFAVLDTIVINTAKNTNMPSYQVINLWMKSRGQAINSTNYWNLYAGYFKDRMRQELARLSEDAPPQDGSMTPSAGVRCRCYELFKNTYPDSYQDILDTYKELNMLSDAPQTIAQCTQTFQKLYRRVGSILDGAVARQGFEATLVMCGNIVNEDSSLSHIHMMPSAGGISFFEKRCRASDDAIIGHMKAHVYNTTSLAAVEQAFKATEGDREQVPIEVLDVSSSEAGEEKDALKSLKAGLIKQVADLGSNSLTNDHLRIKGYPAHLSLMPGESHNTNSRSKGVAGLTQHEVNVLAHALKVKTMCVVKVTNATKAAIIASKEPVIIGEAPPVGSPFPNVRRMFVNRTFDYNGPPHLQTSSAATRKKKPKVASSSRTQDDDGDVASMDSTTTIRPKSNLHLKVVVPPPSRPFKLAKRPPTKLAPTPIHVLSSPDGVNKPGADNPLNISDGESPSEDDADHDDSSRSCKQKLQPKGEEKTVVEKKPSVKAAGKVRAKGGRSSPLVVESSGDEQQPPPGAMHPETSEAVDRPPSTPSTQVMEAPILSVVPSSPLNSDHHVSPTEENGQSVHVPDVPLPLPQNPSCAPKLEDTRLSPSLSDHDAPDPRNGDPNRAHSHEPHDNQYPPNRDHSREPHHVSDFHDLSLNNARDLHPHRDNSPALCDDCRYPSDEQHGGYTYHEEADQQAYARRL
ncbi:uncharacterized protein F5891DRAFT_1187230 [Suillus fuscotomentosus]|uniref:Uncharacterized protein n=1 Tax=Suillus fuscotomentosus TaxID=1912939 RepID=A0AAD4E8R4_9AGAM|nr:uncharacterized protein F5891DRAFT_1187230 [Suillus fuscotomentosus]KAG1901764.1 hypothetical protein F5891DRAFT_1187230 [Suillus fuscotomentosus]